MQVITPLLFLVLTTRSNCQYLDLFQDLNSFLQPFQPTGSNYRHPFNFQQTTAKPKRKSYSSHNNNNHAHNARDKENTQSTDRSKVRNVAQTRVHSHESKPNYNAHNNYNARTEPIRHWYNNNVFNDKENNQGFYQKPTDSENFYGRKETSEQNLKATSNHLNGHRASPYNHELEEDIYNHNPTESGNNYNIYGGITDNGRPEYTTGKPPIYRPGVRPAVVDENRPPITNRPPTHWPVVFPYPASEGAITFTEETDGPEIEIGPDEDDMSDAQKQRYLEIAEQVCDEYKSMTKKTVVALPLGQNTEGVTTQVNTCSPITAPLVIGGEAVDIKNYPHMALVGWMKVENGGYSWKCGGSLISDQYVLTAGHCTYQDKDYEVFSGPPHAVQLGSSYHDDPGAIVEKISSVIRHPRYKIRRSYYDVAIVKLISAVRFSEVISPACLGAAPPVNSAVVAAGWGKTEFGGDHSSELRSVTLRVWDMTSCRDIWGTSLKLPNGPSPRSQLCAGDRQGGKDTCQGDSGGPLQIQDGCRWRVVGITSMGRSCGAPDTPALYAKIPIAFVAAHVFKNRTLKRNPTTLPPNKHEGFNEPNSSRRTDSDKRAVNVNSDSNSRRRQNGANVRPSNDNRYFSGTPDDPYGPLITDENPRWAR